ncbi:hypothetical protein ACHAWF_004271 [Thalassiosira exigua]
MVLSKCCTSRWLCRCWCTVSVLAFQTQRVQVHVAAFTPSTALASRPTRAIPQTRPSSVGPSQWAASARPRHNRKASSTAMRLGIEDVIFNAQNAGSSLANTVISSGSTSASSLESVKSLLVLYAAGLVTSFSPCSLGLLPITVSYITNAANERKDNSTILPTLAFAAGLALVFTALGVSASALGGVFGSSNGGGGGGEGGDPLASLLLAAISSLVSVLMGLQLLELIRIPLPSLDFKWRQAAAFDSQGSANGSLFDDNGGLILDNLQSNDAGNSGSVENDERSDEIGALIRTCLLGGTSALVASPCATPVLASILAYLAQVSSDASSSGDLLKGASWMLSYTLGYSTPLLAAGATGGQALVNLQQARTSEGGSNLGALLGQWITPLSGSVLIAFGMNGFLIALLGDPSLSALAPIIE